MALYLIKGQVITELDPPLVTNPAPSTNPKSVTVNVRSGQAQVNLGIISGDSIILEAGESMSFGTLASVDFVETMSVTAIGTGANVLVVWSHF